MPILWTISDVAFTDGATLSGSFDYDADTGSYSDIRLTTTAGDTSGLTGNTYVAADYGWSVSTPSRLIAIPGGVPADPDASGFPDLAGVDMLNLYFAVPLTDAGGTVALVSGGGGSIELACLGPVSNNDLNANCDQYGPSRYVSDTSTGDATASVPEPASVATAVLALAGLGLARRRRA